MTAAEYKLARTIRGTQSEIARLLGVHPVTLAKRETGRIPIHREAALAMLALPVPKVKPGK